jgi:uncharacterized membrane protein (UPF0127 family)
MNWLFNIYSALRTRLCGAAQVEPDILMQVSNLTRQTVLATGIKLANSAARRRNGLLGRHRLHPDEGLWILPCEAVHTFGMQFSIDLVYLDRKNRIKKLRSEVPPWRLSACFSAHSVLELSPGTIRKTQSKRGDELELSRAIPSSDREELAQPLSLQRSGRVKQ